MEEYIQILIFAGAMIIMAIQQNIKAKNKSQKTSSENGEVLEDIFPELTLERPVPPAKLKKSKASAHPKKSSPPKPTIPAATPTVPSSPSSRIKLNTRKEAKRAFIYSEIFNRKY